MAQSPSHKFGQIIGDTLEAGILPVLERFAFDHGLYLDYKRDREARRGKKVTWIDEFDNSHDLDFVLERGGSEKEIGVPVAFIETAWRRYTRHSKNKAQEIQGAVLPLRDTFRQHAPAAGAILAGAFTSGAIEQLKSHGFSLIYMEYESVIDAFASVGIDAFYEEGTPDSEFEDRVSAWELLSEPKRQQIADALIERNATAVEAFVDQLGRSANRFVAGVRLLVLHGSEIDCSSISEAIDALASYSGSRATGDPVRYEVIISYSNGDRVEGTFAESLHAIDFLRYYE